MKKLLLLLFCFTRAFELYAQQPLNNDCINVFLANRLLCGNGSFTTDNVNGKGLINDFGPQYQNSSGCLFPQNGFIEVQSAWYAFKIQTSGKLTLDIIPLAVNDFDFAIFGPNKPCNALGAPIRCSFAAPTAPTGMNLIAGELSEGAGGDGYVRALDVIAGETYYILINNWSNTNSGFNLNWGGTGKIAVSTSEFTAIAGCNVANFNNTSVSCDGTLGYEWDFGDGSAITSENFKKDPTHYYTATGTYQVKLKTTVLTATAELNVGVVANSTKPVTIIKTAPVVQFPTLKDKYCVIEPVFPLTATPVSGVFTIKKNQVGNFNPATTFDPALLGPGKHEVKYIYQDPTDITCKSVRIDVVTVYALPTPDLTALQSTYCQATPAFALVGNPVGGTFKINNVSATTFNPTALGVGVYTVLYEYTSPISQCYNTVTKQVTVEATPVLAFTNLRDAYCLAGSPFTVVATPAGGVMTINGASSSNFNIPVLGIGNHTIVYNYTSANGCSNTLSKQVQVADKPLITFLNLNDQYCTDVTAFTMQATPANGIFKVNNVVAIQFNPSVLGEGNYTIDYAYIDPSDATCFNSASKIIAVKKAPTLSFADVADKYCLSDAAQVQPKINIVFANGTTSSESPVTLAFVPATVGVSTHNISHTVTDPSTGCVSTITKQIPINANPTLNFVELSDSYCQQAFVVSLKGNPTGGTYSINGVPATQLDPKTFSVGDMLLVSYAYTDANTCSNSISKIVEITSANAFTPLSEDLKICPQPQYMLEAMSIADEADYKAQGITPVYYWTHAVGSFRRITISEKSQEGNYEVVVRDQDGCPIGQKKFKVKVDCEPKLFIPTAFTPNGDKNNELFKIFGEDFSKLDFKIYNRWGEVVFVAKKKEETWDGNLKGKPVPAGIYAWSATFENSLKKGEVIKKQGQFVLIR